MYQGESTPILNRAYGYSASGGGFRRTDQNVTSATRGDGGIYASVSDLALWDQALFGGTVATAQVLTDIFTPGQLNNGSSTGYGFGWEVGSYGGTKRLSHTGSTIGFRSAIQRFPDKRFAVAVLINRDGAAPWDLATEIADRFMD